MADFKKGYRKSFRRRFEPKKCRHRWRLLNTHGVAHGTKKYCIICRKKLTFSNRKCRKPKIGG